MAPAAPSWGRGARGDANAGCGMRDARRCRPRGSAQPRVPLSPAPGGGDSRRPPRRRPRPPRSAHLGPRPAPSSPRPVGPRTHGRTDGAAAAIWEGADRGCGRAELGSQNAARSGIRSQWRAGASGNFVRFPFFFCLVVFFPLTLLCSWLGTEPHTKPCGAAAERLRRSPVRSQ